MAKKRILRKEKPTIETVKTGLRATDFLKVKLCNPITEKLDKIDICEPNIVELCTPNMCLPDIKCYPERPKCFPHLCLTVCGPIEEHDPICDPVCLPVISSERFIPCVPSRFEILEKYRRYRERAGLRTVFGEPTPEIKEMTEELRKIRIEIENLKKKIK